MCSPTIRGVIAGRSEADGRVGAAVDRGRRGRASDRARREPGLSTSVSPAPRPTPSAVTPGGGAVVAASNAPINRTRTAVRVDVDVDRQGGTAGRHPMHAPTGTVAASPARRMNRAAGEPSSTISPETTTNTLWELRGHAGRSLSPLATVSSHASWDRLRRAGVRRRCSGPDVSRGPNGLVRQREPVGGGVQVVERDGRHRAESRRR